MKLDHVQLAMPPGKEAEARAFWVEIFGMVEEPKPEPLAQRGGCWFRKDSAIIHIGTEEAFIPQKKAHPAFVVVDIHGLSERLRKHQYPVRWDTALSERKRFFTEDPFGNRIEILQAGDGFSEK